MFENDNTIYKTYGNNKLMAVKLWSMINDKGQRVTKFKLEFREFDKNREQGKRNKGGIDVYMEINAFTYFCKLLESGRIWGLIANAGNKAAYEHFGGTSTSKGLQIGAGNKGMLITAQEGPGRKTQTGATIPDYGSWNEQNSKKITLALNDEIAVQLGMAGLRAISILDMWTAFGRADQNLDRINPKKEENDQSGAYAPAQPRQQIPQQNNVYAAQGNGYVAQGGYVSQQGYAVQSGQQAGYVW